MPSWGHRARCRALRLNDLGHHPAHSETHTEEPRKQAIGAGSAIGAGLPTTPKSGHGQETSPNQPSGSSFLRRKKVCPKCCEIISVSHANCPHCHTSLSEWTFPLPDEDSGRESRRGSCHYLGLRKQDGVIVVRFGEHRILDELTVKKFGEELFQVADRPDCPNLLLNFTGVVGLSSAMLGIMLMLRKKMAQKSGKVKLCQVGPEIMDVFRADEARPTLRNPRRRAARLEGLRLDRLEDAIHGGGAEVAR